MESYNSTHFKSDMDVMHDYLFTKHSLSVKKDGRLAIDSKISAFFKKLFSCFTGTSFNRDKIKDKLTQMKGSEAYKNAKDAADLTKDRIQDGEITYQGVIDFYNTNALAFCHFDQLMGSDEPQVVGRRYYAIDGKMVACNTYAKSLGRIADGHSI